MNPAELPAPGWTPSGLWPKRSQAEVVLSRGEERRVLRTARRLFGRELQSWQYAGLIGAPDRAQVEVSGYQQGLHIELGDPVANAYRAIVLVRRRAGKLVIVKEAFHIHLASLRRKGLGLRIFHRQLENALALGVDRMELIAGRRDDENGYYTWPRFGFDGPLPRRIRRHLPLGLEHARTVLDLIACEKGRLWWSAHGRTIPVSFHMADHSRCRKVFEQYVRRKLKRGGEAPHAAR